jgi:hypothetical protein
MGVKHIHADLIKAWADGAEIEVISTAGDWVIASHPGWSAMAFYRIKPQPPKEPDYATIVKNGFICNYNSTTKWKAAASDVIKAYQQYQEDMKVYQNGNS